MRWRASELAAALGAPLVGPDREVEGVVFDSREARTGTMFVPIVADRDGHDFVDDAVARGSTLFLSSRRDERSRDGASCILVPDTVRAFMDAASWVRSLFPAGLMAVGITGSVGKTTTKDLVVAAISGSRRTVASIKSYNNEQGLPATVMNAARETEVLVLEMGMRGFGQITDLCRVGRPAIGVVTRVGEAHTELVGGIDGVARAKGELVEALPSFGCAVLNADDERVSAMRSRTTARVLTFGEASNADVRVDRVESVDGGVRFRVSTDIGVVDARVPLPGRHSASNAAAAIATGMVLGVSLDAMVDGLSRAVVADHRSSVVRTRNGATLLDDCYNANPTSMIVALETLRGLSADRRVAVLGLMAELSDPPEAHRRVAREAANLGIEIVAVGTDLYGADVVSIDEAVALLLALDASDAALVKGSRVAALERVVDAVR